MTDSRTSLLIHVRALFRAIEAGAGADAIGAFYDPDAEQIEHPSLMRPTGGRRSLAAILAGSDIGARMVADQRFDIVNTLGEGDRLAVEFTWTGTLRIDAGGIPAGTVLTAHIAAFFASAAAGSSRSRPTTATSPSSGATPPTAEAPAQVGSSAHSGRGRAAR